MEAAAQSAKEAQRRGPKGQRPFCVVVVSVSEASGVWFKGLV